MKKKATITAIIIMLGISAFSQTIYFVDATNGNDTNNGTSGASPWKTISKINQQSFIPGDKILFKRGETWKGEQLEISGYSGSETNLITFGAYPDNNEQQPIITTITEHSHTWTNQGGNIWKANNPPNYHPERLLINGNEILYAINLEEIDGENFFWHYDAEENGDLYLFSLSNPETKTVSYSNNIVSVIIEDANYITLTNLDLQGGWTSVFVNSNPSYIHFNEMKIGKYASGGININTENSSKPNHIHIRKCYFDSFFTFDYTMSLIFEGQFRGVGDAIFLQAGEYCEIDSSYFKNWGHASINIDGNPYGTGNVKVSYISVHDNYATSPDICYGGRIAIDDAHHCELFNNKIINTSVQSQLNGYNNHIHHNIIAGTKNSVLSFAGEIDAGIDVSSYSNTDVQNNIYENNLIINTEGVGLQISTSGGYDIHNNIFRNNIIYNCGTVIDVEGIGILVQEDTPDCQTHNNIFYNNLIFNESTPNTIKFRNTITDITGFNTLQGTSEYQIADNIADNPLFSDPNNSDYYLLSSSPCIDAGTTTLSAFDFQGNAIPFPGTNPDIGIFEFQAVSVYNLNSENIILYPNPARDFITFNTTDILIENISVFDINNREVTPAIINNKIIDISNLKKGIYFLKIKTQNTTINKKVLKL